MSEKTKSFGLKRLNFLKGAAQSVSLDFLVVERHVWNVVADWVNPFTVPTNEFSFNDVSLPWGNMKGSCGMGE